MNYIDLLVELGMEQEDIASLQSYITLCSKDENYIYKKIITITKLFKLLGCNDYQIGKFIAKNKTMLISSDLDLIKFAYVWDKTGVLNTVEKDYYLRLAQINRTYLRYLYLTSGLRQKPTKISYYSMIVGEQLFTEEYSSRGGNKYLMSPIYENLLNAFVKGESLEKKEELLSQHLIKKSFDWYRNKTMTSMKGSNDESKRRSI